jgi:hypothetical protein
MRFRSRRMSRRAGDPVNLGPILTHVVFGRVAALDRHLPAARLGLRRPVKPSRLQLNPKSSARRRLIIGKHRRFH